MQPKRITVAASSKECLEAAQALAQQLSLPCIGCMDASFRCHDTNDIDYVLLVTPDYLGLQDLRKKNSRPFYIDFSAGKLHYRSKQAGLRNELLARAIGLKPQAQPFIVDATAGLGRDSFILASLGFNVTLLEKSTIVHALLADGMQRATLNPATANIVKRMTLIQTDSTDWLATQAQHPDVIYLDPMFPVRRKSAQVKKDMVILQELVIPDDAKLLFKQALACASKRVVVKRPRLAEPLSDLMPSFSITGSTSRFDVYVV